jgi:hypothetical protein
VHSRPTTSDSMGTTWPWTARPKARPEKLGHEPEKVGPMVGPDRAWVARKTYLTLWPGPWPDGPTYFIGIWSGRAGLVPDFPALGFPWPSPARDMARYDGETAYRARRPRSGPFWTLLSISNFQKTKKQKDACPNPRRAPPSSSPTVISSPHLYKPSRPRLRHRISAFRRQQIRRATSHHQ